MYEGQRAQKFSAKNALEIRTHTTHTSIFRVVSLTERTKKIPHYFAFH